jgi:hypothetical protein
MPTAFVILVMNYQTLYLRVIWNHADYVVLPMAFVGANYNMNVRYYSFC